MGGSVSRVIASLLLWRKTDQETLVKRAVPLQVLHVLEEFDIPQLNLRELQMLAEEPDCIWIRMVLDLLGSPEAVVNTLKVREQLLTRSVCMHRTQTFLFLPSPMSNDLPHVHYSMPVNHGVCSDILFCSTRHP
jgi:hypothetical protein